jgi:hypothetical protein
MELVELVVAHFPQADLLALKPLQHMVESLCSLIIRADYKPTGKPNILLA